MIRDFFATKIETSQAFDDKGNLSVVTKLQALPLTVTQIKTVAKDGYWAILCELPKTAHKFWRREIRLSEEPQLKLKDQIKLTDVLKPGELIKVAGISKGKGFEGVVRRHHFKGVGGQTHGQSDRQRGPGSIGMRTTPGRVWKGHRMAGHMGDEAVSIRNLKVISFDEPNNILVVSGTIPGARHCLIKLTKNAKN